MIRIKILPFIIVLMAGAVSNADLYDMGTKNTFNRQVDVGPMPSQNHGGTTSLMSGMLSNVTAIPLSFRDWDKGDYFQAKLLILASAAAYSYDQKVFMWSQRKKNNESTGIAQFAEPFGGTYAMTPSAVLYVFGQFAGDNHAKRTALIGVESVVMTRLLAELAKGVTERDRPYESSSYNAWDTEKGNYSFPSSHSASAFAMATVIATEYGHKPFVAPLAYGVASLTALSRINDNKHWLSDIIVGSALGYYTARTILKKYQGTETITIFPSVSQRSRGVALRYSF